LRILAGTKSYENVLKKTRLGNPVWREMIDWRNLACASNSANLTTFQVSAGAPRSHSIQTTIQELE
jgi:hypothetical protein